jgi:hypothetical protein
LDLKGVPQEFYGGLSGIEITGILTTTSTASLPSAGQWFCVEYKIQCSSADGQLDGSYILYVNGTQIWSVSNVDTDNIYVNRVDVGLTSTSDSRALALYIDCVVVADTYIGPEIVKTWSATLKVSHVSTRPFRVMKLCQNINATHIFQRPARFMRLSQALQTLHAWTVIYPGLILKKWFATLQTTHTFKRPIRQIRFTQTLQTIHVYTLKRLFRLEENLNLTHVLRRPYRRLGYMQQLQPTHILRRPIRLMKLPAALQLTHVFSRPYRVIRLLQQLGLIHVYYVAVPGVKKTKLFLVIGDLAIQLSGD